MKRRIAMIGCIFVLFAICVAGAFFFLQKGDTTRKASIKPDIIGLQDIAIQIGEPLPELSKGIKKSTTVKTVEVDISKVDTQVAGEYPIVYNYQDHEGKSYTKTITCKVEAAEPASIPVLNVEEDVPKAHKEMVSTEIPKTGDTAAIIAYILIAICACGVIGCTVCYKKSKVYRI